MATYDYGIKIYGEIDLRELDKQLKDHKFTINIKLDSASKSILDDLKQTARDLQDIFTNLNGLRTNGTKFSGGKTNANTDSDIPSLAALEKFEVRRTKLLDRVRKEMTLGEQSLFQFNGGDDFREKFKGISKEIENVSPFNINTNQELADAKILLDQQESTLNLINKRWKEIGLSAQGIKTDAKEINETLESSKLDTNKQSIISNLKGKLISGEQSGVFNLGTKGSDLKTQYENLIKQTEEVDIANKDYARTLIDIKGKITELAPEYQKLQVEAKKLAKETFNPSDTEKAQFEKSKQTLISQVKSKLNLGNRSGLFETDTKDFQDNIISGEPLRAQYKKILDDARKLNTSTSDYKKRLAEVQTQVAKLNPAYQALQKEAQKTLDKTDNLLTMFSKKIVSAVAYRMIFTVFNTLRAAYTSIYNTTLGIDSELRDINKVLDLTKNQMDTIVTQANDLATAYARTTLEVMEAMEYFAKAGFVYSQMIGLAELSVKLQNVGDLTSEAASQFLIAVDAAYQFDGSLKSLSNTVDIVNNLSNNAAVTVDFLSQAMKVSGSVAKSAGLSLEEFTAALTTIGEATQRSGREVGNGLKTILLRLQQVNDTSEDATEAISDIDEVLESVGIKVRDTPNSFRPAMETLTELADKWEGLTDLQKRAVTYNLAGVYRSNILESFLANINEYEENLFITLNSVGSATKENELFIDSLDGKLKKLKATWETFINDIDSAPVIKWVIDLINVALRNLDVILVTLSVVAVPLFISSLVKLLGTIKLTKKGFLSLKLSTGQLIGLLSAVVVVVIAIADAFKRAQRRQEEMVRSSVSKTQQLVSEYGQLNILARQYDELAKKMAETGEGAEELRDIQKQLVNQFGVEAAGIDLVNGKYDEQIRKFEKLKQLKYEEAIESGESGLIVAQDYLNKEEEYSPASLWNRIFGQEKAGEILRQYGIDFLSDNFLQKYGNTFNDKLVKQLGLTGKYSVSREEMYDYLKETQNYLSNQVLDNPELSDKEIKEYTDELSYIDKILTDLEPKINDSKEAIKLQRENIEQLIKSMLSTDLMKLQGSEKSIFDFVVDKIELNDFSQKGREKYKNQIKNLINILDGVDTTNIQDKWREILLVNPDLTEKDKKIIEEYVTNVETQFSDIVDKLAEAVKPFERVVEKLEVLQDAEKNLYDFRKKIAKDSNLIGDSYKDFVENGDVELISDPKLQKITREMQDDYMKYLEDIEKSEAEGLNNQESITKLYETQVKLKEKELEILQKQLVVDEKRKELNALENERTQVSFINGQRVYVADYEAIYNAREELQQSEQDLAESESGLTTDKILAEQQKNILAFSDSLDEVVAAINSETGVTEALQDLKENSNLLSDALKSRLGKTLTDVFDVLDIVSGNYTPITPSASNIKNDGIFDNRVIIDAIKNGLRNGSVNIQNVNVDNVDNLDGLIDEIKNIANHTER